MVCDYHIFLGALQTHLAHGSQSNCYVALGFMDYEVPCTVWQEQEAREAVGSVAPAMASAHTLKPAAALGISEPVCNTFTDLLESVTQGPKLLS